ncbi:MAG: GNAT family N-acetyltransferase [Candidatus Thorarchaeota archaeon]
MSDKYTRGKVRDFQLTMEDAGRLAECLNSFDDSDSWPGSFTGGNPFTTERVFEDKGKRKDIRDLVAYEDDKIVGECNVCESGLDDEAAYVGLLGVNPNYQGKGFGKALLIEAAKTAADVGKRRIDLHTWGGNLKAVPLYKRTGYNWVPGTRVLMESHIPGIIGNNLFKEFFDRYNWYDSYKREITQDPDEVVEDGIGVFKYRFEGENGDLLVVSIDREAKGICGFQFTLDNQTLSVSVRPKNHTGYIGYGEYPVELALQNDQEQELSFSVEVMPEKQVTIEVNGKTAGTLAPGESINTTGVYFLSSTTRPINRETNADEKVPTYAEWSLTVGDDTISLYSGLVPTEAVTITPGPFNPCIPPMGTEAIGLGIRNNTHELLRGEINLTPPENVNLVPTNFKFELESGEAVEEPITISIEDDVGNLVSIDFILDLEYKGNLVRVSSKKFNIPVLGIKGAVVYKALDDKIILETESIRATMSERPSQGLKSFEYKPLNRFLSGWQVLAVEIGYPFPSGGDEWSRMYPEIELDAYDDYADVRLTGTLQERSGLRQTVTYRLHSGSNLVEVISELENTGKSPIDNLGIRCIGWFGGLFDQGFVPLRGEIYNLDSVDWSGWRQLPKPAKEYHESWIAMHKHQEKFLLGYIWDSEHAEDARIMRGFDVSRTEYRLPDLGPGEKITKTPLRLYIGDGDWRKVRSLYRKLNGIAEPVTEIVDLRSDLEVEIAPKKSKQKRKSPSPILVDRSKINEHELRIRLIHETPIDADIHLKLPDGLTISGKNEIQIKAEGIGLDHPFSFPLKIEVSKDKSWFRRNGEIEIRFISRIFRTSLAAVVFDSSLKVDRTIDDVEDVHLHSLKTGGYSIAACPEHGGTLVRYGEADAQSILYDTFPKVGPFVWWDKVYSGLHPMLVGWNVWDWESGLQKESWSIADEKVGPWVGYKTSSKLQFSPGMKDMEVTMRYLMLPGTPLLSVKVSITNTSNQWKRPMLGFRGIPMPGGNVCSKVHTVKEQQRLVYEPHTTGHDIFAGRSSWGAYESPSDGTVLGIISAYKWDEILYVDTLSEKAQIFGVRERRALKAGESTSLTGYLVISDNVDTVELLSDLPEVDE